MQLQQAGFDPVPVYTVRPPGLPGRTGFSSAARPCIPSAARTSNRILSDMMPENEVWVNTQTAERHELVNGQYVRLKNQDGVVSNKVRVKVTERIRPECVYMVHGFGHTARGLHHAFGKGASDAQLITRYVTDPLMGGTAMNMNFVTFEPAEA